MILISMSADSTLTMFKHIQKNPFFNIVIEVLLLTMLHRNAVVVLVIFSGQFLKTGLLCQ